MSASFGNHSMPTAPPGLAPKPVRSWTCWVCRFEVPRSGHMAPRGWFRICAGHDTVEQGVAVACSRRCLRTLLDSISVDPPASSTAPRTAHTCHRCRRQEWAPEIPKDWLEVRLGVEPGRLGPVVGLFCGPDCMTRKIASLSAKGEALAPYPPPQLVEPPPIPVHLAFHTCAICFARFPAGAAHCPRGHRVGSSIAR